MGDHIQYCDFTPEFSQTTCFSFLSFPKRLKKFGFRFAVDYWPNSSSPVHSVLNVLVYSHRKHLIIDRYQIKADRHA